jgi:DNA-binding CsgD family transcriptional regulator
MQAEPDWKKMYEWARNMAWKMKAENCWVDELASAAVSHLHKEWSRYRDLPDDKFKGAVSAMLYHEMLAVLADDKSRGTRVTAKKIDPGMLTCQPKHHSTEEDVLQNHVADDEAQHGEDRIDFQAVQSAARHVLTPAEGRVMRIVFRDPEASAAEIAAEIGDLSEGAVKIQKHNALKKLKSFFNNDITLLGRRALR